MVAVPARNEAGRIRGCLAALLQQRDARGVRLATSPRFRLLVLADGCTDGTEQAARSVDPRITVLSKPPGPGRGTAGQARRAAMDAAARLAGPGGGVICTTDADSRPRPDWVAQLWRGLETGAEAVAGVVDFDLREAAPAFSPGRRREAQFSALQAELAARLDPEPHNPWPNHLWAWGANLAVTSRAYRRAGGLPPVRLAEDRAFVERLRGLDIPVRHSLHARVWTSPRRRGRAPGGLADLVSDHASADRAPCDFVLEPAFDGARRAVWRRRLRAARLRGFVGEGWRERLGVPQAVVDGLWRADTFGEAWQAIERRSLLLRRRRLTLADLPREIARAQELLGPLRRAGPVDPADTALAASAGLWSAEAP